MIRLPPRSTLSSSSAASDVYKRQVLACQPLGVRAGLFGRRVRVELETAPHHRNLGALREAGQGGLEPTLADVAPRAGDVGPDLNRQWGGLHAGVNAFRAGVPLSLIHI